MYSKVTANLAGARKRYETLNGKKWLVVPAVMLDEGVWTGNQGPLLYTHGELTKNTVAWNHKPVIIYHPKDEGTACTPAVLEEQGVGMMLSTNWDNRLKTEWWCDDEEKLARLAPTVVAALNRGESVEVSTGLFHDLDPTPGTWNSKSYVGKVVNIQPDHLAILPDQVGAFPIAAGGGLLRNATHDLSHNEIMDSLHLEHNGAQEPWDSNLPHDSRIHIRDVFPKHVVYEKGNKHFKHPYKVKDGKAKFDGQPEEVQRKTNYVTANGMYVINDDQLQGPIIATKALAGQPGSSLHPKLGEMSEAMRKQQFQKTLTEKYGGIEQNGEWGGWVVDLTPTDVTWTKDGKYFQLPYTYDNDKITLADAEPSEAEQAAVSEYRRKNHTPLEGGAAPYAINLGVLNMAVTLTPEQIKKNADNAIKLLTNTFRIDQATAQKVVANAMHAGAHQLIHDATQHMDAHHPPGGASDSQIRTAAGGARHDSVNKMIAGGKWKEEDRQFLMDLPDDHFQKVEKNALQGATQPIVPYTYDGIGDRSNAHTANQAQQVEQWLSTAPAPIQNIVRNQLAQEAQERQRLITNIAANQQAGFNAKFLETLPTDMLRGMARLTQNSQQVPAQALPSYVGQGGVPMFNGPTEPTPTTNEQQQALMNQMILPLPSVTFDSPAAQAQ